MAAGLWLYFRELGVAWLQAGGCGCIAAGSVLYYGCGLGAWLARARYCMTAGATMHVYRLGVALLQVVGAVYV